MEFICLIYHTHFGGTEPYEKACSMGTHIWKTHGLKPKEYYDSYVAASNGGKCAECGNPTQFRSLGQGYKEFCSKKCAALHIAADPVRNAHKTAAKDATCTRLDIESNGEYSKRRIANKKATMMERYGVEYYSQHPEFKEKYHATNLARYGATSFLGSAEGQAKIQARNMAAFGAPYRYCLRSMEAIPAYNAILQKYGCEVVSFQDKKHIVYRCSRCGELSTEQDLFIKFRDNRSITPCVKCEPKLPHDSFEERELRDFVSGVLGVECTHYDRNFLGKYGADIVCETEKVIIEYDGLYWHTSMEVSPDYHIMKTRIAESMGYHLIHVFSDEWQYKRDIVKSRLCNILHRHIPDGYAGESGMVYSYRRIYARECTVCDVTDAMARKFLDANHIQGYVPGPIRIGLSYEGELVALMTFGRSRFSGKEYELLRFCTKLYTNIPGGAARIFAHYLSTGGVTTGLVSYADRRWSSGDAFYTHIGFAKVFDVEPGYSYVVNGMRESRIKYQKHKLVADGGDSKKSEEEIMADRGIYRIYDCGNYKYVYAGKLSK